VLRSTPAESAAKRSSPIWSLHPSSMSAQELLSAVVDDLPALAPVEPFAN
jgi:hypothetical protein